MYNVPRTGPCKPGGTGPGGGTGIPLPAARPNPGPGIAPGIGTLGRPSSGGGGPEKYHANHIIHNRSLFLQC